MAKFWSFIIWHIRPEKSASKQAKTQEKFSNAKLRQLTVDFHQYINIEIVNKLIEINLGEISFDYLSKALLLEYLSVHIQNEEFQINIIMIK
jgi:hypothetical protein